MIILEYLLFCANKNVIRISSMHERTHGNHSSSVLLDRFRIQRHFRLFKSTEPLFYSLTDARAAKGESEETREDE